MSLQAVNRQVQDTCCPCQKVAIVTDLNANGEALQISCRFNINLKPLSLKSIALARVLNNIPYSELKSFDCFESVLGNCYNMFSPMKLRVNGVFAEIMSVDKMQCYVNTPSQLAAMEWDMLIDTATPGKVFSAFCECMTHRIRDLRRNGSTTYLNVCRIIEAALPCDQHCYNCLL